MEGQNSMILKSFFFQFKLVPITRQKWMSYFSVSSSIFYHFLPSQDWHQWHTPSHKRLSSSCSNSCGSSIPNRSLRHWTCVWLFITDKTLPKKYFSLILWFHWHAIMYVHKIKCIKHFCIAADISIVLVLLVIS